MALSSTAARWAVTPESQKAGSNRSSKRRPFRTIDLTWPYCTSTRGGAIGFTTADGVAGAAARREAETAATIVPRATMATSAGFILASLVFDVIHLGHPPQQGDDCFVTVPSLGSAR